MLARIKLFLNESKQELHRVNWPSRSETAKLTLVVIAISVGVAALLGVFDYAFSFLLTLLLNLR